MVFYCWNTVHTTREPKDKQHFWLSFLIDASPNNFIHGRLCIWIRVCVGLSLNEIVNIMFCIILSMSCVFLTPQFSYKCSSSTSSPHVSTSYLVLNTIQDFYKNIWSGRTTSINAYLKKILRWLVVTIRYKVGCLLCLIMLEFLVKLAEYIAIW